jgi:hypothetical protein
MTTPSIVSTVIAAVNAGDTDAFLALFEETGAVDDWGDVYRGKTEIRAWSDRELIGVKARFTLRASEQRGDEASMQVDVGGNGFNGPSRFTFTMKDGRIAKMLITGE